MSEMQRNTLLTRPKMAFYPMKMPFASQFCLDLSLPLFAAATCSAFP